MPPPEKKFGKRWCAIPCKPESPVRRTSPKAASLLCTTVPTTASAARSLLMTPKLAWHSHTSAPGMQAENNHILVTDLTINGEKRHVDMTAPKNGFFYVLDAKTGKLISANPLVKTTWAHSYDLTTGRAVEVPPDQ